MAKTTVETERDWIGGSITETSDHDDGRRVVRRKSWLGPLACESEIVFAPGKKPSVAEGAREVSDTEWVQFGDVARGRCGMQAQYCSRYVDGRHGAANLGDGLRFRHKYPKPDGSAPVNAHEYHSILIHRDDVEEFVRRVTEDRKGYL